ncbi:MAG: hypothetical protein J6J42_04160 [Lachnospiraceae bacterium]|nr:hypothetical protein [Lachnospiraceae bacterium]
MTENAIEKMDKWEKTAEHSVGGFLWLGFSRQQTNKLICISSEYTSVMDCDTGEIKECDADYDEEKYIAVCDCFPTEVIDIYGQYGGYPVLETPQGESISIQTQEELYAGKIVKRYKIQVSTPDSVVELYNNYGYYVCSFSVCGNYFVLADDAGITVRKRKYKNS